MIACSAAALVATMLVAQLAPITTVLTEDWEGSLAGWSTEPTGCTVSSVEPGQAWNGRNALHAHALSMATCAFVHAISMPSTAASLRIWLYIPAGGSPLLTAAPVTLVELSGPSTVLGLGFAGAAVGGRNFAYLQPVVNGAALGGTPENTQLTEGTWHLVELGYSGTQLAIWIDDVKTPRATWLPTTYVSETFSYVTVGTMRDVGAGVVDVLLDTLAVGNAQLGTSGSVALHANELDWDGLTGTWPSGVPPGKAGGMVQAGNNNDLATSTADSKVGARGLRATDADGTTPGQVNVEWGAFSPTTGTVYRRFWWRPGGTNVTGSRTLAAVVDSRLTTHSMAGLGTPLAAVDTNGGTLTLWGYDSTGARTSTTPQGTLASGWTLVELLVSGLGGAGDRRLYLNGKEAGVTSSLNFAGLAADGYLEGQVATDSSGYLGTDSFDEIRTSTALQPSTIRIVAPGSTTSGACTPFELRALSSGFALAPVPELADATLAGANFYSDVACSSLVPSPLKLHPGSLSTNLWFISNASSGGVATLSVTAPDYLSAPVDVALGGPDRAPPASPVYVTVRPSIVGRDGGVTVAWAPSSSPDVSEYSVQLQGLLSPLPVVVSAPGTVATFIPPPGAWQVQLTASDFVGNQSVADGGSLLVDWGVPQISSFTAGPSVGNGRVTLAWSGAMDPGNQQEPPSGIRDFTLAQLSPDGGSPVVVAADAGVSQYALDAVGPDGKYVFGLFATDNAGNQSAVQLQYVSIDRTAPVVTSVTVNPKFSDAGVAVHWTTDDGTNGSGVKDVDVTASSLDGGTWPRNVASPVTETLFSLQEGQYVFGVVAHDLATNASSPVFSEEAIVDVTPPPAPTSLISNPSSTGVDLAWRASTDALSGVDHYLAYASRDGLNYDAPVTVPGTTHSYSASPGRYWFKVTAVDRAANESTASPIAMAIVPGPAQKIALELPPVVWVGQAVDLVVTLLDSGQNQVTNFTGTVHFQADNGGVVPPDYTFTLADAGRHRFVMGAKFAAGSTNLTAATPGADGGISINALDPGSPSIASRPFTTAAVNQPYRYDSDGFIEAYGAEPITYSVNGGTPNLKVDPMTGAVVWTPTTADYGMKYTFTVNASNSFGTASQTFDVTVSGLASELLPLMQADPNLVPAPATVTLSAAVTSPVSPLTYAWEFGDGSAAPAAAPAFAVHRYAFPGSYWASVLVQDQAGSHGGASGIVVLDDGPNKPPVITRILASPDTQGQAPYTVAFSCDVQATAPIASYSWDFGDGATSTGAAPTKTFGPGRYHVHLYVTDTNGLIARAETVIIVSDVDAFPPTCRASLDPPVGPVPALVRFTATVAPVSSPIEKIEWVDDLGSSRSGISIVVPFDAAGWHRLRLKVVDHAGHACWDNAVFTGYAQEGLVPPAIVSTPPATAECGKELEYQPVAIGTLPLAWDVANPPEGLTVDAASGKIVWTPSPAQSEPTTIELRASGAGSATQKFQVDVSCKGKLNLTTGCTGCTAAGVEGPVAALVLLLLAARRRRR